MSNSQKGAGEGRGWGDGSLSFGRALHALLFFSHQSSHVRSHANQADTFAEYTGIKFKM